MPRPRTHTEEEVLERALRLFWERGYDRASISDLSEATGAGPSSLYNAFGSKEELFRRAIERYMGTHAAFAGTLLGGSSGVPAGESIRKLLRGAVRLYTTKNLPPGCAMFQSAGSCAAASSEASAITRVHKQGLEQGLRSLLEDRARAGDALAAPSRILAKSLVGSMRGLSQLACDGASQRDLLLVADHVARSCVLPDTP